jgi:hypothetical protein
MRHSRLTGVLLWALLAAGCAAVDDWAGRSHAPAQQPAVSPTEGERVKGYLDLIAELTNGAPAKQAELAEAARSRFTADPTSVNRLRYAIVLATPGHPASNAQDARVLLGEVLANPQVLLPGEVTIATIVYAEVNERLALEAENAALRATLNKNDRERAAATDRRLQAQAAEIARLQRELEAAQAKLEAVAELEKALLERPPGKRAQP